MTRMIVESKRKATQIKNGLSSDLMVKDERLREFTKEQIRESFIGVPRKMPKESRPTRINEVTTAASDTVTGTKQASTEFLKRVKSQ